MAPTTSDIEKAIREDRIADAEHAIGLDHLAEQDRLADVEHTIGVAEQDRLADAEHRASQKGGA